LSVGANGESIANGSGAVTDSGMYVLITDVGEFVNAVSGMYVYCDFQAAHANGRYHIQRIDDDSILLDTLGYIGEESVTWVLGGAVPATYNVAAYDLEDVLDSAIGSAADKNVNIYVYLSAAYQLTEQINIDSNGGTGVYRKRIIGSDVNYAPLALGSYIRFIDDADASAGNIFEVTVENITMENISAENPAGPLVTDVPSTSEYCFDCASSTYETVLRNCRAISGYFGFDMGASGSLVDCVAYDSRVSEARCSGVGVSVIGGYYECDRNLARGADYCLNFSSYGAKAIGVTLVGGDVAGVHTVANSSALVLNCTFIDQTTTCIKSDHAGGLVLAFNNIFNVADQVNDTVFTVVGSIYEDYNITDATLANSGFTRPGTNSVAALTDMSATSPWVNAASGTDNFRIDRADALAANVIEAGWAPYLFTGVTGTNIHKMSIGAYMTYDLPAIAGTLDSDTVYGTAGTATEGSGGGGQPIIGGSVVR